jgi:hypothetical protein
LKLKTIRNVHKGFGYFLAVVYKINIIWCWYGYYAFQVLIVWEVLWIIAYTIIKNLLPQLQKKITDPQTEDFTCPEIGRFSDIEKVTDNYVIFGDYVYDAR